jgi:hypothetical protein
MARLIDRSIQEIARKVAWISTNARAGSRRQKIRHAIDVTVRTKPPARKVGSRGERMSTLAV